MTAIYILAYIIIGFAAVVIGEILLDDKPEPMVASMCLVIWPVFLAVSVAYWIGLSANKTAEVIKRRRSDK